MRIEEILRMILVNLIQNKFKVLLTSLGIIIGTVTIILVIAIGRGGEKQIADQFASMSAETVYVNMQYQPNLNIEKVEKITPEMLELMLEENPYLKDIYLRNILFQEITAGGKKEGVGIVAVTAGYADISNFRIMYGTDFAESDYGSGSNKIVVGYSFAEKHFDSQENAVGKSIQIKGYSYRIIGVLEKKSEGLQGVNPDESIFLPFQTAEREKLSEEIDIPQVVARAVDTKFIKKAMERLKSTLDYVMADASMYQIEDAGSRIDAATQSARTMKLLLISVAAIVFVVGGIGIMNVLFVSVKERTREIGILKAIGTSRRDILLLFLLESVGMGIFGGSVGILFGCAAIPLMSYTQIPVAAGMGGPVIAFLFAVVTATLFGLYPAGKAAGLKPIDALNYE